DAKTRLGEAYLDTLTSKLVVSRVYKDTGLNDEGGDPVRSRHEYSYGGLVAHRDRGGLGFRNMQVIDLYGDELATMTRTTYKQEFPFTGMVEKTETYHVTDYDLQRVYSTSSRNQTHKPVGGAEGIIRIDAKQMIGETIASSFTDKTTVA